MYVQSIDSIKNDLRQIFKDHYNPTDHRILGESANTNYTILFNQLMNLIGQRQDLAFVRSLMK